MKKLEDQQFQFHLDEYRSLKTEIEYRVKDTGRIEYVIAVAVVVIYAWLSQRTVDPLIWWLPILLPALGLAREIGLLLRIMQIAEYIREIEATICAERPFGWEHFLVPKRRSLEGITITVAGFLFWTALLAVTIAVALNGGISFSTADTAAAWP